MQYFEAVLFGILVTFIGSLPFGLVNLSVLDVSRQKGFKEGMRIAHGAALIEVVFGLTAFLTGIFIQNIIKENSYLSYFIIAFIGFTGIIFLLKNTSSDNKKGYSLPAFWKGAFLNVISIQVLLFWIIVITFLHDNQIIDFSILLIILFLTGIWLGKMGALWLYARLSNFKLTKSKVITNNINRVIGSILLIIATFQFFSI
jgi:threonine/homoserine/homoserine lactone efflux protein